MSIARIRTPNEPPNAAWNLEGVNYTGFSKFPWGSAFEDQECQECITVDRTPSDPNFFDLENVARWPETDDEDDPDWLPDSQAGSESDSLEYNSGSEDERSHEQKRDFEHENDDSESDGEKDTDINIANKYPLSQLHHPPRPQRLPHGTWHNGRVYYTVNRQSDTQDPFPGDNDAAPYVPPEHIAAPSCQSLQGINGHALTVEQMKNCRNVRFLLPKPTGLTAEASDELLEQDSLLFISGESNGSTLSGGRTARVWRSFHPPRHGMHEMKTSWAFVESGCHEYDVLHPLPVHSYCLDIYAKSSYRRLGRVDLDGVWGLDEDVPTQTPEISRGRESWDSPWRHVAGDEWLAANPVEVPSIREVLDLCTSPVAEVPIQLHDAGLLSLPTELKCRILSFLSVDDSNAVALACRPLYELTQPTFKASVTRELPWLWEVLQGVRYPESPNRPATWDPVCPSGVAPPELPNDLRTEEEDNILWRQIVEEDAEMERLGEIAKALNRQRREEIFATYNAKLESSLQEWHDFRNSVADWIRHQVPDDASSASLDWRRVWRLFNPTTTKLPGIRSRAHVWMRCEQVLNGINRAHEYGRFDEIHQSLLDKLSDPSHQGWRTDLQADDWWI
ncbi:uncharacterized protein FTOL_01983 [Fusarium torulosum]|uniref:F-box domain-containing protein n=1 Tax=Fusarium torulosum TaxID=33205 RepID=A0AAE8SDW3_9HYPO|nr:uncharacterized protein FTOL_01983 [Fusarium torulosum]